MEFIESYPFVAGLLVGLFVAALLWLRGVFVRLGKDRELKRLKDLLATKLEIEAKAQRTLSDELESLRKQNENLRVSLKTVEAKPDRQAVRQLHVYDQAIRALLGRSPGFGPAWQTVLEEAERQVAQVDEGLVARVRRTFSREAPLPSGPAALPSGEEMISTTTSDPE